MPLLLFGTHKRTFIAFVFIALAITGFTIAKLPPAQQPAPPNNMPPKTHQELVLNHTAIPLEEPKEPKGDIYIVTAYNLSVQSCGKPIGHPQYGITASGYSLAGHTWYTAKTIAVDTELIPLGSKVLIKFLDEKFKEYNGVYIARDTGSAIKGHKIDLFIGDFKDNHENEIAISFGVQKAEVFILT